MGTPLSKMLIITAIAQRRVSAGCKCLDVVQGEAPFHAKMGPIDSDVEGFKSCPAGKIVVNNAKHKVTDVAHIEALDSPDELKQEALRWLDTSKNPNCWVKQDEFRSTFAEEFWANNDGKWTVEFAEHCPHYVVKGHGDKESSIEWPRCERTGEWIKEHAAVATEDEHAAGEKADGEHAAVEEAHGGAAAVEGADGGAAAVEGADGGAAAVEADGEPAAAGKEGASGEEDSGEKGEAKRI